MSVEDFLFSKFSSIKDDVSLFLEAFFDRLRENVTTHAVHDHERMQHINTNEVGEGSCNLLVPICKMKDTKNVYLYLLPHTEYKLD